MQRLIESKLKWRFRRNHQEDDFGIDGYIDLVSENGEVLGKTLGIQIKTGLRYSSVSADKQLIFRGDLKHLNYFLNSPVPILVVVVDENREAAYWAQVLPSTVRLRKANWTLAVPRHQRLDGSAKRKLTRLAGAVHDFIPTIGYFENLRQIIKQMSGTLFLITKPEILNQDVSRLKQFVEMFHADAESLEAIQNKLSIGIHGYDKDVRELYEIPEVRQWFKIAEREVMGWPFYLMASPDSTPIKVFLFCTSELKPTDQWNAKKQRRVEIEGKEIAAFLERQFASLNSFAHIHGLSTAKLEIISKTFGQAVQSMFTED